MRLNASIAGVLELSKSVDEWEELGSSLGRSVEDNLWYLTALEWIAWLVEVISLCIYICICICICICFDLDFDCSYLYTSPIG